MAFSKTGSAIIPSTFFHPVVMSVASLILLAQKAVLGRGYWRYIFLVHRFCGHTAAHRAKLAVIATAMAIRFSFCFLLRYKTSARSPGSAEE